ncbi:MAG TPA: hypothetical protein VJQ43_00455 [Thermoplasmata archaeon]|nr:hypothetical protein [Thermoplasmata archaeon]
MTISGSDVVTIVIVAVFAVLIGRRLIGMVLGTPVRTARLVGFAVVFTLLFVVVLAESFAQIPVWTYGLDAAIVVVASVTATRYVRRHVVLEWRNGEWYYRLRPIIPAAYLVLFGLRLALDAIVLGIDPFRGPPPNSPMLTGTTLLVVLLVDALFSASTGLLVGRSAGVILEHRQRSLGGSGSAPTGPATDG